MDGISAGLVSQVNAVLEQVREWQAQPLDEVYPIVYLDCLVLKIRQDTTQAAAQKWMMPIQNWKQAMNRFAIEFEEQLTLYL